MTVDQTAIRHPSFQDAYSVLIIAGLPTQVANLVEPGSSSCGSIGDWNISRVLSAICPCSGSRLIDTPFLCTRTLGINWAFGNISNSKSETGGVDILMSPEENGSEHWLREEIQDSVEDGLRVGRDDVATLANAPCDGIADPHNKRDGATSEKDAADITSNAVDMDASFPGKLINDVGECSTTCVGKSIIFLQYAHGSLGIRARDDEPKVK